MGQQVVKLDPFHVVEDATDGLNPIDVCSLPGADVTTDSQMVAHLIASGNQNSREPFWDLNGCGLVNGVNGNVVL